MRHGFSVDKHSDDESCDRAIEQLSNVVELGKQAQAALDSIREHGFFKGKAPVTGSPRRIYSEGHTTDGHEIRFASFQQRVSVSRTDLPPLENLQLEYEPSKEGTYGGHSCVEVPLYCKGMVAVQIDHFGLLKFKEDRQILGRIRINKHHLSFVENSTAETVQVHRSGSAISSEKYKASAMVFAKRLARMMINVGYLHDIEMPLGDAVPIAAKTEDLQNAAPQWFIDDKIVERMFDEIHRYICILRVMDT